MKKLLKTSLVACSLLAFGFAITSQVNAATNQWSKTADVNLAVEEWQLTIGTAKTGYIITGWTISGQVASINLGTGKWWDTLSGKYNEQYAFYVSDLKWSQSGWYTTVSVSDLSGQTTDWVISKNNVSFKAGSSNVNLITGSANDKVVFDSSRTDYTSMSNPLQYILRGTGADGANKLGIYGDDPRLQVEIPQFTPADQYKGIITYTLYEND